MSWVVLGTQNETTPTCSVAIDAFAFGPHFHGPEDALENVHVGHEFEDHLRGSITVEAPKTLLIQGVDVHLVEKIEIVGDLRDAETGKGHVYFDIIVAHLQHGNVAFFYGPQLGDLFLVI